MSLTYTPNSIQVGQLLRQLEPIRPDIHIISVAMVTSFQFLPPFQ